MNSFSSLPHDSAHTHVTGQSEYIDDRPRLANEVNVEVVFSPYARARIRKIDDRAAQKIPGYLGMFTAKDIHHNRWGTIFQDQPLLAETEVFFAGEAVCIVAAETEDAARAARDAIRVDYDVLPAILSIEAARKAQSFIAGTRKIERGEFDRAWQTAPHKLEGTIVIRGADHFYLESQASVVYPREDGQLEVHSSSQHPTETQHVVAHALGLESKDVTCIVKRMGGGFGGKESQAAPFAAYAALVASRLKRPARIILTKDDDMIMTGKRNPFENLYRVGFDHLGRILALEAQLFSDGGAYADLSTSIMERAMLHCDNAYYLPNVRITGQVCRTHYHPHTAFRGFGGPKGVATIEKIIEEIAHRLKKDPLEVRKLNCYTAEGGRDIAPYGQKVENNCLPRLFSELERDCDYGKRRAEIKKHNAEVVKAGQGSLRGLSLTAVKFGISFTTRFLNQANALVILHTDGSLQVSTGATEMGQGVNARIAEAVAREFGITRENVRLMPTSTDKNANTSPTAASSGTDLNAAAAVLAARRIKARLSHLATHLFTLPEEKWAKTAAGLGTQPEIPAKNLPLSNDPNEGADWQSGVAAYEGVEFVDGGVRMAKHGARSIPLAVLAREAYLNRISLSDYAHYRIPNLDFNKLEGKGQAFLYFTQGTAASEVEVDIETGEVKVRRVDVLMDLGRPINAALDVGQVTGGFVQGQGWVTTEKLFYNRDGLLLAHSPSTYKIPSVQDAPRDFRVRLLPNEENRANYRGTKAVGEPPLLLALSVWTAVQDAVRAMPVYAQKFPQLEIPATQEQVLRALYPDAFAVWESAP